MLCTYDTGFFESLGRGLPPSGKSIYEVERAKSTLMALLTINHLIALLALILGLSSYLLLKRYGVPDKICLGAAFLAIVVIAIFWTSVQLGAGSEDDE